VLWASDSTQGLLSVAYTCSSRAYYRDMSFFMGCMVLLMLLHALFKQAVHVDVYHLSLVKSRMKERASLVEHGHGLYCPPEGHAAGERATKGQRFPLELGVGHCIGGNWLPCAMHGACDAVLPSHRLRELLEEQFPLLDKAVNRPEETDSDNISFESHEHDNQEGRFGDSALQANTELLLTEMFGPNTSQDRIPIPEALRMLLAKLEQAEAEVKQQTEMIYEIADCGKDMHEALSQVDLQRHLLMDSMTNVQGDTDTVAEQVEFLREEQASLLKKIEDLHSKSDEARKAKVRDGLHEAALVKPLGMQSALPK